ncbi:MAG: hypothetical protein QOH06_5698 [Acidobacteriota bacterium]|nr:hypothetical protein [Acidobacteriota bacterium]
MTSESNWSDKKKWLMGIISALIVAAAIALFSYLRDREKDTGSEPTPTPFAQASNPTVTETPTVTPPPSETPPPTATPTAEGSPKSETIKGVRIDLLDCRVSAGKVTCRATLTQAREGYNHVLGQGSDGSYMWDMQGNQYQVSRVRLGAQEGRYRAVIGKIPANTPTRVELVFEGVPSDLETITTLLIATNKGEFTFRDISLSK